jgi:hypothetical protein
MKIPRMMTLQQKICGYQTPVDQLPQWANVPNCVPNIRAPGGMLRRTPARFELCLEVELPPNSSVLLLIVHCQIVLSGPAIKYARRSRPVPAKNCRDVDPAISLIAGDNLAF